MARQAENILLDARFADCSKLHRFYLGQEKTILGTSAVIIFLIIWELVGNVYQLINPMFMSAPSLIFRAGIELFRSVEIESNSFGALPYPL